jgi:hypothetical protein
VSEQNSYELLGLTEASSFEDIQAARDRLVESCGEEPKQKAAIEAAYDAILMERLRLRQEGKIRVPDRIRFAENNPEPPPVPRPAPRLPRPQWLNDLVEAPSREGALWPALSFTGLTLLSLYAPSLGLAVAIAAAIYFLNRKEYRFWRSVLLTIAGLVLGMVLGALLAQLLVSQGLLPAWLTPDAVAAAFACLVLWVCSSFLR